MPPPPHGQKPNWSIRYYANTTGDNNYRKESVDSEKDLGVIIDKSLSVGEHISSKIFIANRNLGLIFRTFTFMDKDMFLHFNKSLVRPHLEYATSVWLPLYKKDMIAIGNVQRLATRLLPSFNDKT